MHGPDVAAEDPGDLLAAGGAAYVDDRLDEARAAWERAFVLLRTAGACAPAARVATLLGELHAGGLGNVSVGRGWFRRAERLLDEAGPCVERGYWELGQLACDRADVDALLASADRALALAIEYDDVALQTRALADAGYALVASGRLREGFARLEEALAAVTSGEVTDPFVVSTSCCAALSACDRAGDSDRATEWLRVVHDVVLAPAQGRPRMLGAHCQVALGGVLCAAGRWSEAELAIRRPLESASGATASQRVEATARLAELCILTGRYDDAAELVASVEDSAAAAFPRALLWLRSGEPRLAAAAARRGVDAMPGDVLRSAALLAVLVEAELETGDVAAAERSAARLDALADGSEAPFVAGLATVARARLLLSAGSVDAAVDHLREARHAFEVADRPLHAAEVDLLVAEALAAAAPDDAVTAARSAHATAVRLGAAPLRDRSAALLRTLGASPPRSAATATVLQQLSAREVDVLDGIRRGESNAQIAARLFLSPKTVERHVSNIFGKLGVRNRVEAATAAGAAR